VPGRAVGRAFLLFRSNRDVGSLPIRRGLRPRAREWLSREPAALGPYTLQASIAACHARARTPGGDGLERIVGSNDALGQLLPRDRELNSGSAWNDFGPERGESSIMLVSDRAGELPLLRRARGFC